MGVLQAARMRGVFRLNKESTFSGRLLLFCQARCWGVHGGETGKGRISGVEGQKIAQKEPRAWRSSRKQRKEGRESWRGQEINEENCGFNRETLTEWLIKNTNTLSTQGCVLKIYGSGFEHVFSECVYIRLLVCVTLSLVFATYCRTSQHVKPWGRGSPLNCLCVYGWWWEITHYTPSSRPQRNSQQAQKDFFFYLFHRDFQSVG